MNQFIFRRRYNSGYWSNYALFYYNTTTCKEIEDIILRINRMLYDNCIGSAWERINKFR